MVSVVRWLLIKPILSLFTILVSFQNHFPSFIMMDFAKNEPILIALQLFETLKNDVAFPKKKVPTYISFRRLWEGPPSLPLWGDVVYGWSLIAKLDNYKKCNFWHLKKNSRSRPSTSQNR